MPDQPVNLAAAFRAFARDRGEPVRVEPFWRGEQWGGEQPLRPIGMFEKKEGKRGEELFHLILSGVREVYEVNGIIAGGAVRDLAAGVTDHKDVDVFLPMTSELFWCYNRELGWQGDFHAHPKKKYDEACVLDVKERISSSCQFVPLDILLMDKPLDQPMVDKFPVHAQRCIWTLEGGLIISPEAKKDIDNKTFTIDPTITDKDRIRKVLEKINGWKRRPDYKNWKVVEPDVPEWWEAKAEQKEKDEARKDQLTQAYNKYWAENDWDKEIVWLGKIED